MNRVVEVRQCKCPFCDSVMLLSDSEQRTYHAAPACEQWLKYCKDNGGKLEGPVSIDGVQSPLERAQSSWDNWDDAEVQRELDASKGELP